MPMSQIDFWFEANDEYLSRRKVLRFGQAAFIVLERERPELAEAVRGTECDPFYSLVGDSQFARFEQFIRENWDK